MIHRNLTCSSVLLDGEGHAKITMQERCRVVAGGENVHEDTKDLGTS